ncbi:hypothetical protein L218DRAFT_304764 [Marasmius fiardii PR-910]|nr:hypothetical protein L218DRAFT_304764 [Marasmius fiardii PR-910]
MTHLTTSPEFQSILKTLSVLSKGKDDILGTIADLALEISEYYNNPRVRPLVVTSCEAAYVADFYTKYLLRKGKGHYSEGDTAAKLGRLIETLDDILLLTTRVASRGPLLTLFVGCVGFWETKKIRRLRNTLKTMIIHDFWPEDRKRFSI